MAAVAITVVGEDKSQPALAGCKAMEKGLEMVKFAAAALGITLGAMEIVRLGKEAVMAASQYDTLGVTMEVLGNTAGYTSKQMDGFEESLSRAGIVGSEARQNLALMAENHVDLAHAAGLSTIAQNAAAVAGISVSEAFQRIAFSVDTGNARTLRSMGITINYTKAYQEFGRELGKNADELSDYEKTQARVQALEAKGPDIEGAYQAALGTTGGQIRESKKLWMELLEGAGAAAQPVLMEIITGINGKMKELTEWFKANKKTVIDWGYSFLQGILSVEAEIIRMGMLLDKAGGTMTAAASLHPGLNIMAALGNKDAQGIKNDLKQINDVYRQKYQEKNTMLEQLAARTVAIEQNRADAVTKVDADAENARLAKGAATRAEEKAAQDAEVAEKRYIENVKDSVSSITNYTKAVQELGKERLEFAKSDYTDKLTNEFDLYKQGKEQIEDLTKTVKTYGVTVNDVFNQRLSEEKDGLSKLSALYADFKSKVQINALTKEAKAAGVEILKAYRDTAQGIVSVEQQRYKTLLAGEEEYCKKMLETIRAKQKELDAFKQQLVDYNKLLEEEKRKASGDYSGGYQYLNPNLDSLAQRQAGVDKLRRDEAEALAILDPAAKEAALLKVRDAWNQYKEQVDLTTTSVKTYADFTKALDASGADIPFTTESITKIDTVITKIDAVNEAQTEQKRINEEIIGLRQTDLDKEQQAYDAHRKTMDMYKAKLLDLDNILKNMTRTITIDLRVNGMEQINRIQGFVGSAASPIGSSSGRQDFGDYYTQGGNTYWNDGSIADSGTGFVGSFAVGTSYVPKTGMALVHQGEAIIPAGQNKGGGAMTVTIEAGAVVVQAAVGSDLSTMADAVVDSLARKLMPKIIKYTPRT